MKERAPQWPLHWDGKVWSAGKWDFDQVFLWLVYKAIPDGPEALLRATTAPNRSWEPLAQALSLLKKAGLITYDRKTRRWLHSDSPRRMSPRCTQQPEQQSLEEAPLRP